MILQLRFANSGCNTAMEPSSVVHTGVKSFGCENKIAQPLPIHSWKLIAPWVVSAVKSGASELIRKDMCPPFATSYDLRATELTACAGAPRDEPTASEM